jgi:hypothetical protein
VFTFVNLLFSQLVWQGFSPQVILQHSDFGIFSAAGNPVVCLAPALARRAKNLVMPKILGNFGSDFRERVGDDKHSPKGKPKK